MFSLGNRRNADDRATYEPLLGEPSERALEEEPVIFSVTDEDEDFEEDGSDQAKDSEEHSGARHVHFQEEVRVIAPSLRSTLQSRETGV